MSAADSGRVRSTPLTSAAKHGPTWRVLTDIDGDLLMARLGRGTESHDALWLAGSCLASDDGIRGRLAQELVTHRACGRGVAPACGACYPPPERSPTRDEAAPGGESTCRYAGWVVPGCA